MVMFERLLGDGATPEQRLARKKAAASILDGMTNKVAHMKRELPASDRARLDDYLENVREIERRLQQAVKAGPALPGMEMPLGAPPTIDEHIKLVWDIQHLAFQADITRVSAMLFCRDESATSYPESGVNTANHGASHHREDDKLREDWAKINRYFMKTFAVFAEKMRIPRMATAICWITACCSGPATWATAISTTIRMSAPCCWAAHRAATSRS